MTRLDPRYDGLARHLIWTSRHGFMGATDRVLTVRLKLPGRLPLDWSYYVAGKDIEAYRDNPGPWLRRITLEMQEVMLDMAVEEGLVAA